MRLVAAVMIEDGRVFAAQRGAYGILGGKWEFPGGKIEKGEEPQVALRREILEELKVQIEVLEPILTVQHSYPTFDITLEGYRCTLTDGEITLTEHQGCGWFTADEVAVLDWAEADLPIVERIQALLR